MDSVTEGATRAREPADDLPRRLGPLRLVRRLGAGGMGTVYEATVEDAGSGLELGARVAAKVLRGDLAGTAEGVARLRREAQLGARVRHPGVVRPMELLDLRDEAGPCLALVMELVQGSTLRALMTEMGPLPEPLVRHLGLRLAEALSAVHAQGILHRDIKPESILLTQDRAVKPADLGIARGDDTAAGLTSTDLCVRSVTRCSRRR